MSDDSATTTKQSWDRYARSGIGRKLVTALDAKALKDWHAGIAKLAPTKRGKTLPFDPRDPEQVRARRATANRVLTIAKAALRWARLNDQLPDTLPDFWTRVQPFTLGDDPIPRMLNTDEITRLLNAADADVRDLLTGALMTGARYGDLRSLNVADFNAERGVVRLEDVSFKVMRATYGKLLLLATKDLELVAKALGHSDSRITRKHYAQYLPNEVAAGIAKLPKLGIRVRKRSDCAS